MTDEISTTILWLKEQQADSLIPKAVHVTHHSSRGNNGAVECTLGDGGYTAQFVRENGRWFLDHVSGNSANLYLPDESFEDACDILDGFLDAPTIHYAVNPDDPTTYVAAFAEDEVNVTDSFGQSVEVESIEVSLDQAEQDVADSIWSKLGPSKGEQILVACWNIGSVLAVCDLLRIPYPCIGDKWQPFTPDDLDGDIALNGKLFCRMVGMAFGPAAERSQRQAFAGVELE